MKCSEFVRKYSSIKTLKELSELSGVQVRTLQNWYDNNKGAFVCILAGAISDKDELLNVDCLRERIGL